MTVNNTETRERGMHAPESVVGPAESPRTGAAVDPPSPADVRPYAFLCYSSDDKDAVRELYSKLVADGVRCWLDEQDLRPGERWNAEIDQAIRRSRWVLACLSRRSVAKAGYVQRELRRALEVAEEQPGSRAFIIPVRLEICDIPDDLRLLQWVDLFEASGYRRLVDKLTSDLRNESR